MATKPGMRECFRCGREMKQADGCDEHRTITFADGETMDPIPFGEERRAKTYQEQIDQYRYEIKTGGRGDLDPDWSREELKAFKDRWEEDEYNNHRRCHDCGVKVGEYHHPGCDMEECPRCRKQYFINDCITEEKKELWERRGWSWNETHD